MGGIYSNFNPQCVFLSLISCFLWISTKFHWCFHLLQNLQIFTKFRLRSLYFSRAKHNTPPPPHLAVYKAFLLNNYCCSSVRLHDWCPSKFGYWFKRFFQSQLRNKGCFPMANPCGYHNLSCGVLTMNYLASNIT